MHVLRLKTHCVVQHEQSTVGYFSLFSFLF